MTFAGRPAAAQSYPSGPDRRARGGLARSLLFVLLPLILVPLVTFALLIYRQVQADLVGQVNAQLTSLSTLKESQVNQWASSLVADINNLARSPDVQAAVGSYMADPASGPQLTDRLHSFLNANPSFEAVMIANPQTGEAVLSTVNFRFDRFVGQTFLDPAELSRVRLTQFMLPPRYDERLQDLRVLAVAPMVDPQQGVVALVIGFVRDETLREIVAPSPGLGQTGRSFAVTSDGYQLGSIIAAELAAVESDGIDRARMDRINGSGIYLDQNGQEVFGVYRWLPLYQMVLMVETSSEEALAPLRQFANLLILIGLTTVALSTLGVVLLTRQLLTDPLQDLTTSAQRMAAGDLTAIVNVRRRDEIGILASAFNSMGGQLRELYQDLEGKVEARTRQLEAAAEVGRAATSILSSEDMLARSVELIRDRFGYYHVSIFLLDDSGRQAVVAESTGEIGAQLKARGHRLAVGSNSLIGWVTANRKPRVALDVGGDAVHFQNELLPDTRSEAALPLRVGDRLLGALDVQSRALNAFSQSDIEVLQVLADQIAIALENGRLFARQEQAALLDQRVAGLTAKIHRSLTLEAILQTAANELGQAFGAHKVVVRLDGQAQAALAGTPAISAPAPASDNGAPGNGAQLGNGPQPGNGAQPGNRNGADHGGAANP